MTFVARCRFQVCYCFMSSTGPGPRFLFLGRGVTRLRFRSSSTKVSSDLLHIRGHISFPASCTRPLPAQGRPATASKSVGRLSSSPLLWEWAKVFLSSLGGERSLPVPHCFFGYPVAGGVSQGGISIFCPASPSVSGRGGSGSSSPSGHCPFTRRQGPGPFGSSVLARLHLVSSGN